MGQESDKIKELITMHDLADKYGLEINAAGFTQCPFHQEKTPSMKIYKKGYMCFGCNSSGSVIDMIMKMFNLNFRDAIKQMNKDFGLSHNSDAKENQEWERTKKARDYEKRKRQWMINDWLACKRIIETHPPTENEIRADWLFAINRIDRLEYELGLI